ncbi:DNA cytosine methyltransferase [Streptococcus lutetiensis]|uniref:DNA cytosine methyltransferase n=1 Tax=Streptococcus lutetiensis TaxID=150055 RepID=UPI001C11211D|nr:DNA (cytosine-5-)-methyltransferase [Streptococcus lutetiensis]MBU5320074.1 DNA cytosine methyltransferase [Streptococcus lutetiensis]
MIKYLDLFAGCGGLSEGFLQTKKFEDVASVEWQEAQVNTLRNRLKVKWRDNDADKKVLHFDIQREQELFQGWKDDKKFKNGIGLDSLVNEAGGIDMIIGGPPCQAYSIAGRVRDENGMHDDYRNFLFEHYLSVVSRYQPKFFVFENVPGMLSANPNGINIVNEITKGFRSIGYKISNNLKKDAVLNASDYDVPQNRKRVIIFGVRNSYQDEHKNVDLVDEFYKIIKSKKVSKTLTVEDAIGDLPKFKPIFKKHIGRKSYEELEENPFNWHKARYHNLRDMEIFRLLSEDIESGRNKYINSEAISRLYEEKVGSKSPIHRYHVLRKDLPSTTIIAHLHKDGNRFIHYDPKQARTLTPREAARIQSFPDDFEFLGTQSSVYQMIGNAVPPVFAEKIASSILDLIDTLKG